MNPLTRPGPPHRACRWWRWRMPGCWRAGLAGVERRTSPPTSCSGPAEGGCRAGRPLAAPLAGRRRFPVAVMVVVSFAHFALVTWVGIEMYASQVVLFLGFYSVGPVPGPPSRHVVPRRRGRRGWRCGWSGHRGAVDRIRRWASRVNAYGDCRDPVRREHRRLRRGVGLRRRAWAAIERQELRPPRIRQQQERLADRL
ncbi:hypothetical protein QJS66_07225 [Kocuria rhizophila]|nr:hypothetical protein QJS66_07225 [Kocuria rhizophila]